MLEVTIVLPIFFFVILAIIDFGRIVAMRGLVQAGANEALSLATKAPHLQLDFRPCSSLGSPPPTGCDETIQSNNVRKFEEAKAVVEDLASRIPVTGLLRDGRGETGHPDAWGEIRSIEFIRPGDPNYPADQPQACRQGIPFNGYETVMNSCPIRIVTEFQARSLLLRRNFTITLTADGFREPVLIASAPPQPVPPPPTTTSVSTTTTTSRVTTTSSITSTTTSSTSSSSSSSRTTTSVSSTSSTSTSSTSSTSTSRTTTSSTSTSSTSSTSTSFTTTSRTTTTSTSSTSTSRTTTSSSSSTSSSRTTTSSTSSTSTSTSSTTTRPDWMCDPIIFCSGGSPPPCCSCEADSEGRMRPNIIFNGLSCECRGCVPI